jgi:hypothetical protein
MVWFQRAGPGKLIPHGANAEEARVALAAIFSLRGLWLYLNRGQEFLLQLFDPFSGLA